MVATDQAETADGRAFVVIDCEKFTLVFEHDHFLRRLAQLPNHYNPTKTLECLSNWMPGTLEEIPGIQLKK